MSHKMVQKFVLLIIFWIAVSPVLVLAQEKPPTWVPTPEERANYPWIPGPDEVFIGQASVGVPLGRVLLARKGSEYCAFKFTNTWLGETKYDHYTSYEFYYQGDGSGDFSRANVKSGTGELFFPRVRGWMGIPVIKGAKDTIECGGMKFKWGYIANISTRTRDAELAPTPWTSITEVNVHDPRIRWYRKDSNRKRTMVHIDRLWDNQGSGERRSYQPSTQDK